MFVYTLYKSSMSVYGYVFVWKCKLCLHVFVRWACVVFVYMYEQLLYCLHVWMAPGKISCELTGSPSLSKVFELNWIDLKYCHIWSIYLVTLYFKPIKQKHTLLFSLSWTLEITSANPKCFHGSLYVFVWSVLCICTWDLSYYRNGHKFLAKW